MESHIYFHTPILILLELRIVRKDMVAGLVSIPVKTHVLLKRNVLPTEKLKYLLGKTSMHLLTLYIVFLSYRFYVLLISIKGHAIICNLCL